MKSKSLISKEQVEKFHEIFLDIAKIKEFREFLDSLPSDEARIELIKNPDKKYLGQICVFEERKSHLYEFLASIQSYDQKLVFIKELYDGYVYGMVNFPFEILDSMKPEDRKEFIQNKDLETKSKLLKKIISFDRDEIEKSKKIFFDDNNEIDKKFKIICDAKTNFQILSFLANSDDFGIIASDKKNLFSHHNPKIKEELPENPLPDIYAEIMNKVDSDQAIELSEGNKIFISESKLKEHASYFIFHVNAQNQLTKISYCDGNKVCDQRYIDRSRTHINSVTNFNLATPIEFSPEFAKNFIQQNSMGKDIKNFYDEMSSAGFKFKGLEATSISSISYEMPRMKQKRGNCVMKSLNILACAILQLKDSTQEFGWDHERNKPAGKGYENYKEFKDKLSQLALKDLEEAMPKIQEMKPKEDGYRQDLFEAMREVYDKRIEYAKTHFAKKVRNKDSIEQDSIKQDSIKQDSIEPNFTAPPSCFSFLSCISNLFGMGRNAKLLPPDKGFTNVKVDLVSTPNNNQRII